MGYFLDASAKFKVGEYSPFAFITLGSSFLSRFPKLESTLSTVTINLYAEPGLAGTGTVVVSPEIDFEGVEIEGSLGLEMAYEPELNGHQARFFLGGKGVMTFQVPAARSLPIRRILRLRGI